MAGLGVLSPLFLLGALTVAVPIVLHLLRQRAGPVQPFSAVKLLRSARVEQTSRRRLRDLLLFALRAMALTLLAVGFARPYLAGATSSEPPVTVIVADVSGSLSGDARTARLRELARAGVDAAPASDAVALVQFATAADVLVAPTRDRGVVRAAVARLTPGFGATSYRAGLARGAEVIGTRGGRLVVVTDLQAGGWTDGPEPALPSNVPVSVEDVGPLPPDAAVASLDQSSGEVTAQLRVIGPARDVAVRFEVNGQQRATRTVSLGPGGAGQVSAPIVLSGADALRAVVVDPQGLPADDERWLLASGDRHAVVGIITSPGASAHDALYVQRALQALDGRRAVAVGVASAERIRSEGVAAGTSALIVIGTAGLDRRGADRLADFVRQGGGLLVAVGPGVTPELLAAGFGDEMPRVRLRPPGDSSLRLVAAETRHPALAVFANHPGAFADARFTRTASLLGTSASEVLARFDSGEPALVATPYGKGRLVLFASDLANRWNDLVLQPAFVPLIAETVGWLVASERAPSEIVAGATPLRGTDKPGVVSLPVSAGQAPARAVVNADPREFDPARQTAAEFLSRVPRQEGADRPVDESRAARDEAARGFWRYALALVLASLVVESIVGRRA